MGKFTFRLSNQNTARCRQREGEREKRVESGESPSPSLSPCLRIGLRLAPPPIPILAAVRRFNHSTCREEQDYPLKFGEYLRFGGASITTLAECGVRSALITVLYSISRRKNLLTCRLALHSAVASSRPRNYPNSVSMAVR